MVVAYPGLPHVATERKKMARRRDGGFFWKRVSHLGDSHRPFDPERFAICYSPSRISWHRWLACVVGRVRQRGGKSGVAEVVMDHSAAVAICGGTASSIGSISSAIGSVCM